MVSSAGFDRRQASSGSGSSGRRHRTTRLPPVPYADPRLLQVALPARSSFPSPTIDRPVVDPEALPAKRNLNEWGAFTGGGKASLSPLLFRHGNTTSESLPAESSQRPMTGRELVERDRLMRLDPLSFNPLQAASWAKLDDDDEAEMVEEETRRKEKGKGKATWNEESETRVGGSSREDEDAATANVTMGYHQMGPAPSPFGNMAHTYADVDMTEGNSYIAPSTTSASLSSSMLLEPEHSQSQPSQGHRKRKHRRRHEKTTAASPTMDVHEEQHHQPHQQADPPALSVPAQEHPYPLAQEQQHQVSSTKYTPSSPTSTNPYLQIFPQPGQHPDVGLLLCLVKDCPARYRSQGELQEHYEVMHPINKAPMGADTDYQNCSYASCTVARFTSKNALAWHVKAEHLLQCPIPGCCDRTFPSRTQLETHMRKMAV